MGKLINFFETNKRLFIVRKHQNTIRQEKYRSSIIRAFLSFCEENNIFHTCQISQKIVEKFFNEYLVNRSESTKKQYFLVIRHFFKRFLKKELSDVKKLGS
jgi:site-specific recombinase XerD